MAFFDNVSRYVRSDELTTVSLRVRMAWAAYCLEEVVRLLSPSFGETFLQNHAVDCSWQFAIGTSPCDRDRQLIISQILELLDEGIPEREGYGNDSVMAGGYILEEIDRNNGVNASNGISCAAVLYGHRQLWIQGVATDAVISTNYIDDLQANYFAFTRTVFQAAQSWRGEPIREMFQVHKIDLNYTPLPANILVQAREKPPVKEQAYLQNNLSIPSPAGPIPSP